MASTSSALPLRARKAAKTRLGLIDTVVEALRERPLAQITVRSLCDQVGISEPTFFKYFPAKEDLLVLFVQLWSIELSLLADDPELSGHGAVALIFEETARQMRSAPRVMHEVISYQMAAETRPRVAPPTVAELTLRFPGEPQAWGMRPRPVQHLFRRALERARERGELRPEVDLTDATWTLVALFFGVPASTRSASHIVRRYGRALDLAWAGLRVQETRP